MPTTHRQYHNLAASTDEASAVFPVPPRATKVSIGLAPSSSFSGTGWVVTLQHTLSLEDHENWVAYQTTVTFTNSTKTQVGISVSGRGWIRLKTTTEDGSADPAAPLVVRFNNPSGLL